MTKSGGGLRKAEEEEVDRGFRPSRAGAPTSTVPPPAAAAAPPPAPVAAGRRGEKGRH